MILALDMSTKNTGYAIFNEGELITYGEIGASSTILLKRIRVMTNRINELLKEYPITKIVAEEVIPETGARTNIKTQRALMYLQAALELLIYDNYSKIKIEYIYPSSWRAKCGIKNGRGVKRETLKEADINYVIGTFNIKTNDDIADAICIGHSMFLAEESNEVNWG